MVSADEGSLLLVEACTPIVSGCGMYCCCCVTAELVSGAGTLPVTETRVVLTAGAETDDCCDGTGRGLLTFM